MTTAERLAALAEKGSTVEVTRTDGKTYVGVPVAREDGSFAIRTGQRGRPATVTADTVAKVARV